LNSRRKEITLDATNRLRLTFRERVFNLLYPVWNRIGVARRAKRRRVDLMLQSAGINPKQELRILEIGCGNGQDFISHFRGMSQLKLFGMDIDDYGIQQPNFSFVHGDATNIPFPDGYFDLVVSIGVLEHIEPISRLLEMTREIERVGKAYSVVVPSIATRLEPHTMVWRWQLKPWGRKRAVPALNYFSDEAWLQFDGFRSASIKTFAYLPVLIKNTLIFKRA
jgi:ubiquinone/menaquinone biosynthesis C-methylase UbiE